MNIKYFGKALFFVPVILISIGIFFCFQGGKVKIPKENFETFGISAEALINIKELSELCGTNFYTALSLYMIENNFFDEKKEYSEEEIKNFFGNYKNIKAKYTDKEINPYRDIIINIFEDLKTFPTDTGSKGQYYYGDSYGAPRTYGGKRIHKGTDIFDSENIRGRLAVYSMTDGVIEKTGWNEKGGYRVGIRSENGVYYYYAHLDSYAEGIREKNVIKAGTVLGYMGDSGYGKEGTRGNFPVHLHIGISPETKLYRGEVWVNPYPFLKCLEKSIIQEEGV
ncbi:MAG: M23 family metallopeptidase [Clostridiales bacterium]|nr:M23 family metallopeptidase [Clostridiales bacterium]